MMKYPYTVVCTDDAKMVVYRLEAMDGPQASQVSQILFNDWNHYVLLSGHPLLLDENVNVKEVDETNQYCIEEYNNACMLIGRITEDPALTPPKRLVRLTAIRDHLKTYMDAVGIKVE